MLVFLNKALKYPFSSKHPTTHNQRLTNASGQVAVVLILIIAIGLVFYAVTLNFGRISQVKTLTMTASNSAATLMGSFMMSYGEKVLQEQLGGVERICYRKKIKSGFFGGFFSFFVVVAIMVVAAVTGQWQALLALKGLFGVPLVLSSFATSFLSGVLKVTMLSPEISGMSGAMISDSMNIESQFIEFGVSTALRGVVSDQVQVPDLIDIDTDGLFGDVVDANDPQSAPDYVSRFGHYFLQRTRGLGDIGVAEIENFVDELSELKDKGTDDWGLHDPINCPSANACCGAPGTAPAICDPCCQEDWAVVPPCCDAVPPCDNPICDLRNCCAAGTCGDPTPASCAARSPYLGYPFIYDPYYENSENAFLSLREQIGFDDEHDLFLADRNNPDQMGPQILDLFPIAPPDPDRFKLEDTTGFYTAPVYGAPEDNRNGIFPFFYKIADWGTELSALNYGTITPADEECHWCDDDPLGPIGGACNPLPLEIDPQLDLLGNPPGLYNGGWCVDEQNMDPGAAANWPPQKADNIPSIPDIFHPDNSCATGDTAPIDAGWKRGADMFCSPNFPYAEGCPKHGSSCQVTETLADGTPDTQAVDCMCGEGDALPANFWQDDNLDDIVYGLGTNFLPWAENLINTSDTARAISFTTWYDEAADWIEPPCGNCPEAGCPGEDPPCCDCPGSYTKKRRSLDGTDAGPAVGGGLWAARAHLRSFYDPILAWINSPNEGDDCFIDDPDPDTDSVWCVPPEQPGVPNEYGIDECSGVNPAALEVDTFDSNLNGVRGDMEDVVACLDWNINDTITYADLTTATGNAEKFAACRDECSQDKCDPLPRSLVPGFGAVLPFGPGDPDLEACLSSANVAECVVNCVQPPVPPLDGGNVFIPPAALDLARINAITTCNPGDDAFVPCCDGTIFDCNTGTPEQRLTCVCTCNAGSCSGWSGCPGADTTYYDDVAATLLNSGGSCGDVGPGGFVDLVQQSAAEAQNQVAKFQKRHEFLSARLVEATNIVGDGDLSDEGDNGVIGEAIYKLTEFLDGGTPFDTIDPGPDPVTTADDSSQDSPSELLIEARQDLGVAPPALPAVVVYAWQDILDKPRENSAPGYWHIVKVETRTPKRCNNACGVNGASDPAWPHVGSFFRKSSRHVTQCYFLVAPTGTVKVRVSRYDEDRDSAGLKFPSGQPIWNIRFFHPDKGQGDSPADLEVRCQEQMDPKLRDSPVGSGNDAPWRNAFMLNRIPDFEGGALAEVAYADCWKKVHELLETGINTETCAEYFYSGGFDIRFVDCDAGFRQGMN